MHESIRKIPVKTEILFFVKNHLFLLVFCSYFFRIVEIAGDNVKEKLVQWHSEILGRPFEMVVFGKSGFPLIIFPTATGGLNEVKDLGLVQSIESLVEEEVLRIYCPDSYNPLSWFNQAISAPERLNAHLMYEKMVIREIIEPACTENGFNTVGLVGFGFGGFQAANLAFRHPQLVSWLISIGSGFDIRSFLDNFYDDKVYFNNPPDYLPNLWDRWYLDQFRAMKIILGTGEWDFCVSETVKISNILNDKGIAHWLDVVRWAGHDWLWWREMFIRYISLALEEGPNHR